MCKKLCILLFIPFGMSSLILAQVHQVPKGVKNNTLKLCIKNDTQATLQQMKLKVEKKPDWIVFHNHSISIDSLPAPHGEWTV